MLTQRQVQRYSNDSGLHNIMIVEKGVVQIFLLQFLSDRGRPLVAIASSAPLCTACQ